MVAITVVLAATIYVWVSGMGKGGTSAPSLSATADNVNHRLIISQADKGLKWSDVKITVSGGASYAVYTGGGATNSSTNPTSDITGGDYILIYGTTGTVDISLTYQPTNTNWGTWTVYVS